MINLKGRNIKLESIFFFFKCVVKQLAPRRRNFMYLKRKPLLKETLAHSLSQDQVIRSLSIKWFIFFLKVLSYLTEKLFLNAMKLLFHN